MLSGVGLAGNGACRQILLKRQMPKTHFTAAAYNNAAIHFFLFYEFRRKYLRGPALLHLYLTALGVLLHGQREILQKRQTPFRRFPSGPFLPGARQPRQNGLVEIGPLLGHGTLI